MDFYDLKGKHFLVSQKAFIVNGDKLLILKNSDEMGALFNADRDTWSVPGGLLEVDEDFQTGLNREVLEETGLKVEVGNVFGIEDYPFDSFIFKDGSRSPVRFIEIGFLCRYLDGELKLSSEHSEFRWATKNELKQFRFSPDAGKLVEDYIRLT